MTMYKINNFLKIAEQDDFNEGCLPDTAQHSDVELRFKSATIEDLLDQVAKFFSVKRGDILINSCEEQGRIDIQTLENSEGYCPSQNEIAEWKLGNAKLWACTYTGTLEACDVVPFPKIEGYCFE